MLLRAPTNVSGHPECVLQYRESTRQRSAPSEQRLLDKECASRNVWSAASSQAKSEGGWLVCANVYGLCWSEALLARMECAALSSHLTRQSWKTISEIGFRERRVGPLCHLIVRPQTGQEIVNTAVARAAFLSTGFGQAAGTAAGAGGR